MKRPLAFLTLLVLEVTFVAGLLVSTQLAHAGKFIKGSRAGSATQLVQWREPTRKGDRSALSDTASYNVKYGTTSGTYTTIVSVAAPVTSKTLTGLLAAVPIYVVITTVRADGTESPASPELTFTP